MIDATISDTSSNQPVNILWTGGWDSTFRMIQLAVSGAVIQPYYVIDTARISSLTEIRQMYIIKDDLSLKYKDCEIRDIKLIELSRIDIPDKYVKVQKKLLKDSYIGSQYIWLAALSEQIEDLELSIHKDDTAEYFVRKLVNKEKGPESDEFTIFGRLKFPILDYTKPEMEEEAKTTGDLDILYKSWFCHKPINNTPCGICNPCRYTIAEGMGKRFTVRGKIYNKAPRLLSLTRKVVHRLI